MALLSLSALCDRFNAHQASRNRPKTVSFYRDSLRVVCELPGLDERGNPTPPLGPRAAMSLTAADLDAFVRAARAEPLRYTLQPERHRELSTVNAYLRALKAALRWAADGNGLRSVPIRVRFLRTVAKSPVLFTTTQLDALMRAAAPRERLLVLLLGATAGRISEVLHMKWADVVWDRGEILITAKPDAGWTPKTHHERGVFIPAGVLDQLRAYRDQLARADRARDGDWIFQASPGLARALSGHRAGADAERPRRWKDPYPRMRVVFRRAGLYTRGRLHHVLRKAAATAWIRAGVDVKTVSELLGHADVTTTLRHYVVADERSKRDAALRGIAS